MFDGFWYGIFGGLFGPTLAQWLGRFKYWVIFLTTTLAVHVAAFILDVLHADFLSALNRSISFAFTAAGFFVPLVIGLLAVFVAFIGSLGAQNKNDENSQK